MHLTQTEREMLAGGSGRGVQMALEIVIKLGELYGAGRLLTVKRAHIDAAAYTTIWDAGTDFVEYLVANGARVAVPTTTNPCSRDIDDWEELQLSPWEFAQKSARLEKAYLDLGVSPTWTCAPYECTNSPAFGEVVSWSESNAVAYVNSVFGARANRLPDLVDVCCAVTGRVPEYGLFLSENRAGDRLFDLVGFDDNWFQESSDYAVLGYLIGEIVVSRNPVIRGLPESTTCDQLKAFGAAAASGGAVSLFHAVGITPEAPTLEAAFQSRNGYQVVTVTPAMMRETRRKLTTFEPGRVGLVLTGCPYLSYSEIQEIHDLMRGRTVAAGTRFWIQTSRTVYELLGRSGLREKMKALGIRFIKDCCLMSCDPAKKWDFDSVTTDSAKIAQYVPGLANMNVALISTADCVESAVSGRWQP